MSVQNIDTLNKEILDAQLGECYICGDVIDIKEDDLLLTPCNHLFHYDCVYYTFKNNITINGKYSIRECPYCRKKIKSYLPKFKINEYPYIKGVNCASHGQNVTCTAILKSGKKKGMICGCKVNLNTGLKYCGRHKNYKPPIVENNKKKIDSYNKLITLSS